jgi:predicted HAD superfamily Cof-like phosphohydrolase
MKSKKSYLEQVKEFHQIFQPETVVNEIVELDLERRKLRINLIFEELSELAQASGIEKHFLNILEKKYFILKENKEILEEFNKKETLDALCDLQYVLSGTILEFGMDVVFDEAFDEVHRSNMSKAHDNREDAEETVKHRLKDYKEDCFIEEHNRKFIVKRKDDKKIIKNKNYSKAELDKFLLNRDLEKERDVLEK